jgi:hypothetical protein
MLTRNSISLLFLLFALASCITVSGQTGRLGQTWNGNAVGALRSVFAKVKSRTKTPQTASSSRPSPARNSTATTRTADPLKFVDTKPSGVSASLADALGRDASEKKNLADAFDQILDSYNAEMRKENKSNDLAAAMTFFIVANMATYCACEPLSDAATEELYDSIAANMRTVPTVAAMSAYEKHQVHDWLAGMGGFIHAAFLEAKNRGDTAGLEVSRELAAQATKLVLGVDISEMAADVGPSSDN